MPSDTGKRTRRARRLMLRIAREPLAQFLAIALVLFGANQMIHGPDAYRSGEVITISQGRVEQIADSYRLLSGRLPSRAELQALVADFADEEIAYREAVAMGLDTDDTIVRRRLRQKLEFLVEDAEAIEEPSDAQLAAFLSEGHRDYRLPERISFRQIFVSQDTHGARAYAHAQSVLEKVRSGADPTRLGDTSMLPSALAPTTEQGVALLFGDAFAASLFGHSGTEWFGPLVSPLGAHVVVIIEREPARNPAFSEIRDKLRSDWIESRREAKLQLFQARLRDRYEISIEWPDHYETPSAAQASSTRESQRHSVVAAGD
jgi:hypothetical protein